MAIATPYSGFNATCKVTPLAPSGGSEITIPGTDWTLSDDAKLKDCNNFRDGRLRIQTLHDSNFSATLIWDSTLSPSGTSGGGLAAGNTVGVTFAVGIGKTFSGTFILNNVEISNPGVEDVVMYKVSGVLSAQSGTGTVMQSITYPSS